MTFREMASHHGFGNLPAVAAIKPAPIVVVDDTQGSRQSKLSWGTTDVIFPEFSKEKLVLWMGPRTWT